VEAHARSHAASSSLTAAPPIRDRIASQARSTIIMLELVVAGPHPFPNGERRSLAVDNVLLDSIASEFRTPRLDARQSTDCLDHGGRIGHPLANDIVAAPVRHG
jgi:hypothetical protein